MSSHPLRHWPRIVVWILCVVFCGLSTAHAQQDFQSKYARGKVLLRQKLYVDAIKEFYHAVYKTPKGKKHFGAHYYLAIAYYRLGNITQAVAVLNKAKPLIKNKRQRDSRTLLKQQIAALFGKLRILPQVDPDAVGRLRLKLAVKNSFSHPQKIRAYRIIRKFWARKGLVIKGATLWLPKGEYSISIAQPQCLAFGLTLGGSVVTEVSVGDQASTFALQAKQSCRCEGGQVMVKTPKGPGCTCPKGTVWSPKGKRCEIPPKAIDKRGWAAKNWGWIVGIGVVAVGGAAAGVVAWQVVQSQDKDVKGDLNLFRP